MLRARGRDERLDGGAFERALELLDLTLADRRWRDRLREIARARELLCDAAAGGAEYGTTLEDLDRYFLAFALAARAGPTESRRAAQDTPVRPGAPCGARVLHDDSQRPRFLKNFDFVGDGNPGATPCPWF